MGCRLVEAPVNPQVLAVKKTSIGQKFGPKNMAQTDLAVKWMIGSTKKTGPIGGTHVVRRICLVPDHFRCAQICDFCLFVIHTERGLRCEANLFCTKCNSFSAKLRWFSTVSTVYIYIYMIHIFILKIPEGCPFSYCHTFQKP